MKNFKTKAAAAATTVMLAPGLPMANSNVTLKGVEGFADTLLGFLTGPLATAAGAIAIAFVGYRWFSGRMELGRAMATIAGIVLVIGSVQIVEFIRQGSALTNSGKIST